MKILLTRIVGNNLSSTALLVAVNDLHSDTEQSSLDKIETDVVRRLLLSISIRPLNQKQSYLHVFQINFQADMRLRLSPIHKWAQVDWIGHRFGVSMAAFVGFESPVFGFFWETQSSRKLSGVRQGVVRLSILLANVGLICPPPGVFVVLFLI